MTASTCGDRETRFSLWQHVEHACLRGLDKKEPGDSATCPGLTADTAVGGVDIEH